MARPGAIPGVGAVPRPARATGRQRRVIRSAQRRPVQATVHGAAPRATQRRMQRAAVPSSAGQAARQANVIRSAQVRPVQRHVTGAPTPHQQRKLERAAPPAAQGRVNWHLARHRVNRERQVMHGQAQVRKPDIANVLLGAATQGLGGGVKGATQTAAGITPTRAWTAAEKAHYAATGRLPGGTIAAANTPGTDFPLRVLGGIAMAAKDDPISTAEKTAKGLGQLVAGTVSAVPQLGIDTVREAIKHPEQGPGSAIAKTAGKFFGAAAKDYSRRYGGVASGTEEGQQAFQKRIGKEGAAPELVDIASLVVPGGAVAGRLAGSAARAGALGPKLARVASEGRPGLRVAAGRGGVVGQGVSKNLIRAAGQRYEDLRRIRKFEKRERAGMASGKGTGGLLPVRPARGVYDRSGEVVTASKLLQRKGQRVVASRVPAHNLHAQRLEQHRLERVARKAMRDLTPLQQQALAGPVGQRVVDPRSVERALAHIETRRADIAAERALQGTRAQVAPLRRGHGDELALLDELKKNAPAVFGGEAGRKLVRAWRAVRDEQIRVEGADPALHPLAADVRRARPEGEFLGVPFEEEHAREVLAAEMADMTEHDAEMAKHHFFQAELPAIQKRYLRRIDEARAIDEAHGGVHPGLPADAESLPGALYVRHEPRPTAGRLERSHGGARANAAPRPSAMTLFREGRANTHPDVLVNSLLAGVKRRFNWDTVGQQFDRHALRPDPAVVRRALGTQRNLDQLTPHMLRKVLDEMGANPEDWRLWNPGRFYEASQHAALPRDLGEEVGSPTVHAAVGEATMPVPDVGDLTRTTQGWYLVPAPAHDEITASTRPSGIAGRVAGKAMGTTSAVLLGLSPGWEAFQIAANSFVYGASGRNPLDILTANRAFRGLPAQGRQRIEAELGAGMGRGHGRTEHLGAAGNPQSVVRRSWAALRQRPDVQALARAGRGEWPGRVPLNPIEAMFSIDDFQNSAFRRGALYSSAKRELMAKTAHDAGRVVNVFDHIFSRPSRQGVLRTLENRATVERLSSSVDDLLGDYTRYSSRERRYLKRGIIFYGFFRYAIKALLYTLPKRHPVALALTAKLAQLHNEQVNDLLGMTPGDPEAPWAYSRLFFGPDKSIDLARMSPVETPITQVGTEGPKALGGFLPPYVQLATDQIYGGPLYKAGTSGSGFKTGGNAEENRDPSAEDRLRILANSVLGFAAPYRIASAATQRGKQGDDTLLWDPRPTRYKGQIAQQAAKRREAIEPGAGESILQGLFPVAFPKPDTTRTLTIPAVRRKRKQPQRGSSTSGGGGAVDWSRAQGVGGGTVDWSKAR